MKTAFLGPLLLSSALLLSRSSIAAETSIPASASFDHASFNYRMELRAEKDAFRIYGLSYPSPVHTSFEPNNTIPAELYLPKSLTSKVPRPAVICLHILDGNEELVQIACSALAARGIPAIWFNLPYYGPRAIQGGRHAVAADPALFASAIAQSVQDVRRTVDVLASRPEIAHDKIGVMGISLGGILAAAAAESDPRIARATFILAGGDLLPVIHHAKETRELDSMLGALPAGERTRVEQAIEDIDPVRHADRLRDRAIAGKVLMINAANDEVIPRVSTEKLAERLGIAERVVWLDGLGHYTALAALPRSLHATVDFFAQDLPAGVQADTPASIPSPGRTLVRLFQQVTDLLTSDIAPGRCHIVDCEISLTAADGKKIEGRLKVVHGSKPWFKIECQLPSLGEVALGLGAHPWMESGNHIVFEGEGSAVMDPLSLVAPQHLVKLQVVSGLASTLAMAPDILDRWVTISDDSSVEKAPAIRIVRKDRPADQVRLIFDDDRTTPRSATFDVQGMHGEVTFHRWQFDREAADAIFDPPAGVPVQKVPSADLSRMFASAVDFAAETFDKPNRPGNDPKLRVVAQAPDGHGTLFESKGKRIMIVDGTPAQMGAAHGALMRDQIQKLSSHVLYVVGAGDSIHSGVWSFDRFAEIERRVGPHLPTRYVEECDAMALAAGISTRDGRAANLFPERFHCSGVAVCGKATKDGRVLHARVLDYMRDIRLQDSAVVTVFMPEGRNRWISHGYAGFIGTVTAMNEKGLAIGEMGGRGEGDWDGMPMSFLLRDIMERASTVEEALDILRKTPRTCEYYYVISDKSRAMAGVHCDPKQVEVLRPGEQNPRLPHVPDDTVLVSGSGRAEKLSERLQANYGKIDAATLIDIIKRPVAMASNLHDAVFSPETLELWVSDAGATTPACDEPYAHFELQELIRAYETKK